MCASVRVCECALFIYILCAFSIWRFNWAARAACNVQRAACAIVCAACGRRRLVNILVFIFFLLFLRLSKIRKTATLPQPVCVFVCMCVCVCVRLAACELTGNNEQLNKRRDVDAVANVAVTSAVTYRSRSAVAVAVAVRTMEPKTR